MQVQVITGQQASGKTTQLRAIQADLKGQGIEVEIITGNCCTTPYFVEQLKVRAASGAKSFMADDCTRPQIQAVMEWRDREESRLPEDLIAHPVRQAWKGALGVVLPGACWPVTPWTCRVKLLF